MISDDTLAGPHGPLRIRIHTTDGPARAGLVWSHGGGFVAGDIDMPESEQVARELAARGITVVTVDYALAPAAPYPVPQDEIRHAYRRAVASDLDAGGRGWSIGGVSAGGSLTASAVLGLVDAGDVPASVVLAYPTVHAELPPLSDELARAVDGVREDRRFHPEAVRAMNEGHLGHPLSDGTEDAFAGGADLTGWPSTFIVNSEGDDLRASGEQFARELAAAGVAVECVTETGTIHGHLNDEGAPAAIRSIERMAAFLLR